MSAWTPNWREVDAQLRPRLTRVARAVLRDAHEAEDAVQDAYLRALRNLGQLRDPAAFPGWLYTIARSAALDRNRRVRRAPRAVDSVREALDHREPAACDAMQVAEAFARLPAWMQCVLEARARGLDIDAIAVAEGITRSAARTRLSRACNRLRALVRS